MSRHDSELSLHQMLDHAREAMTLSESKSSAELIDDRMLSLALVRLMKITGVAANRVPKEEQSRYPEIPWNQIIGLRNRLIHGYDTIDYEVLWHILNRDLPGLVFSLERILGIDIE